MTTPGSLDDLIVEVFLSDGNVLEELAPNNRHVVEVLVPGIQGPRGGRGARGATGAAGAVGPAGPVGTASPAALSRTFNFPQPVYRWEAEHNLGFEPAVGLYSPVGVQQRGLVVENTASHTVVEYDIPAAGRMTLS